ncbi:hypothetical protein ABL78_2397 [Leptomonas seymouri]|uniref:RING-type domain-containing protein n=1 Tax=Leptomonas seymouri TaxID=5684 RepID=A0A0N1I9A3_LEPSE|nr:hypothetical protein ABL78_2397 [Leptomonas seymouri]|eukprot:KPI88501.1 hypothetical protein ABL78_2397 [Leptomonas seymouri]
MSTRKALAAYIAASFVATALFVIDCANSHRAFYSTMVALANSSTFRLMMLNTVVVSAMLIWFALQFIFFGKLNGSEETALVSSFVVNLAECIIVPLYFNFTLMSTVMVFFVFTLIWRLLHKLAAERVTTLSTTQLTFFPVGRMVAYLNFVLIVDFGLIIWLIQSRPDLDSDMASLHYSLLLIYMLLATSSLRSAVRFGSLFVLRGHHTLLPFVASSITSIAESLLFIAVFLYVFMKSTLPLLLLRSFISHVMCIFEKTYGLFEFLVLTRKVRRHMPDATAEDLARFARCTICYEDMAPGSGTKRMPCGHCYHAECLEHWLEGHSTCPYCRAEIMSMPDSEGANAAEEALADGLEEETASTVESDGDSAESAAPADPLQQRQAHTLAEESEERQRQLRQAVDLFAEQVQQMHTKQYDGMAKAAEGQMPFLYQQYLNRADPTYEPRSIVENAEATAATPLSPPPQLSSSPPAAQAHSPSGATPALQTAEPWPDIAPNTLPQMPKTVENLKLEAYMIYHRRLQVAEAELKLALIAAKEHGLPA